MLFVTSYYSYRNRDMLRPDRPLNLYAGITFFFSWSFPPTDVGAFTREGRKDQRLTISLGQPLNIKCPPHQPNYGAVYTWIDRNRLQFNRTSHVAISPETGELFFMYVTQDDVNKITTNAKGISCTVTGANSFFQSGLVTLSTTSPGKKILLKSDENACTVNTRR